MKPEAKKILFLEDDGESMVPLKEYLESKDWIVELTANAAILQRLAHERFDLLLVDLMIYPESQAGGDAKITNVQYEGVPWKKTGLEFIKRLREGAYRGEGSRGTPADVPVIVLSAVANEAAEEESEAMLLADRYIEKPYRLSVLKTAIEELLKRGN